MELGSYKYFQEKRDLWKKKQNDFLKKMTAFIQEQMRYIMVAKTLAGLTMSTCKVSIIDPIYVQPSRELKPQDTTQ